LFFLFCNAHNYTPDWLGFALQRWGFFYEMMKNGFKSRLQSDPNINFIIYTVDPDHKKCYVLGLAKKGNKMTQSYQWLITSTGSFGYDKQKVIYRNLCISEELPENFEDACHLAYDHCKDDESIRVLRLDRDTNTFEDQTDEAAYFVALHLLDPSDQEYGFPEWAQDAFDSIDKQPTEKDQN